MDQRLKNTVEFKLFLHILRNSNSNYFKSDFRFSLYTKILIFGMFIWIAYLHRKDEKTRGFILFHLFGLLNSFIILCIMVNIQVLLLIIPVLLWYKDFNRTIPLTSFWLSHNDNLTWCSISLGKTSCMLNFWIEIWSEGWTRRLWWFFTSLKTLYM